MRKQAAAARARTPPPPPTLEDLQQLIRPALGEFLSGFGAMIDTAADVHDVIDDYRRRPAERLAWLDDD